MAVETSTAVRASGAIRHALGAELPPEAWDDVDAAVRRIDAALDAGDDQEVAQLAAWLESLGAPVAGPPRARGWVLVAVIAGFLAVGMVVFLLLGGSDDGDPDFGDPGETTTTTVIGDETVPIDPSPGGDLTIVVGGDGVIEFVLEWTGTADLDLTVTEPGGAVIDRGVLDPTSTGGRHGGDANNDPAAADTDTSLQCIAGDSREDVSWPDGGAVADDYLVEVSGFNVEACGSGDYVLTVRSGARTASTDGTVGDGDTDEIDVDVRQKAAPTPAPEPEPPTTSTATSQAAPPAADDDGSVGPLGIAALVGGAAVAGGLVWAWTRRRTDGTTVSEHDVLTPSPHPVQRRLLAPTQTREQANHTIHRLDLLGP